MDFHVKSIGICDFEPKSWYLVGNTNGIGNNKNDSKVKKLRCGSSNGSDMPLQHLSAGSPVHTISARERREWQTNTMSRSPYTPTR